MFTIQFDYLKAKVKQAFEICKTHTLATMNSFLMVKAILLIAYSFSTIVCDIGPKLTSNYTTRSSIQTSEIFDWKTLFTTTTIYSIKCVLFETDSVSRYIVFVLKTVHCIVFGERFVKRYYEIVRKIDQLCKLDICI